MIRKSLLAALALRARVAAAPAQTEIQCWHSMGGALGDKVNDLANKFNASRRTTTRSCPCFKGTLSRVDDRGDRRVPRRQRAAHPAGLRGRHRDDDGRQGRDRPGRTS